jgi:hypothetical protein
LSLPSSCLLLYGETPRGEANDVREFVLEKRHTQAAQGIFGDKDDEIMYAEYMYLRTQGTFTKKWKRWWFVLKRDFCLYQYVGPEDPAAKQAYPLPGASVETVANGKEADRDHAIKIVHIARAKHPMYFDCESAGGSLARPLIPYDPPPHKHTHTHNFALARAAVHVCHTCARLPPCVRLGWRWNLLPVQRTNGC